MATVLYIILAIAVLLLMVLIHEFGHYVVGRMLNFKITEFSVGFGKAIFKRKNKRGELISLRIFPLGGYCAFEGEDEDKPNPDAFNNQAPWKRILVFLAGVTFNFAAAVIFSTILLCTIGYDVPQVKRDLTFSSTSIENLVDYHDTTATLDPEKVLQDGDVIISIDGEAVDFAYGTTYQAQNAKAAAELNVYLAQSIGELKGEEAKLAEKTAFLSYQQFTPAVVERDGERVEVQLGFYMLEKYDIKDGNKVQLQDENGELVFEADGVTPVYQTSLYYGWNSCQMGAYVHTFGEALERAVPFSFGLSWSVLQSLWQMITFQIDFNAVGGPITTISTIASYAKTNIANLLILIPLISANLAVFNILPIPALDGSHIIFTLIEWIRKKPIKRETENLIHTIGLFLLFGLVILIDILHFVL